MWNYITILQPKKGHSTYFRIKVKFVVMGSSSHPMKIVVLLWGIFVE